MSLKTPVLSAGVQHQAVKSPLHGFFSSSRLDKILSLAMIDVYVNVN